jgi:hypothetical protein
MSALPPWIDERLTRSDGETEIKRQLLESMCRAEHPSVSVEQLQASTGRALDEETVRTELDELQTRNVVASATYAEPVTLYYVDHPEASDGRETDPAVNGDARVDELSLRDFLTVRNAAGIRNLVLAGFQLSLFLLAAGVVLTVFGLGTSVQSDVLFWDTALELVVVCLLLYGVEGAVRRIRS